MNVRRQSYWNQFLFELIDNLAHLVGHVMRRRCGVASAGFAVCFV
jgi:hypothetical protein